MVNAALLLNHTVSHVESMEEDACNPKSDLGQIEQDAGLVDEVNTFCASKSFFRREIPSKTLGVLSASSLVKYH